MTLKNQESNQYITTSDYTSEYSKFSSDILDAKIKQKEIPNKSDIYNLVKNSDLNTNKMQYKIIL